MDRPIDLWFKKKNINYEVFKYPNFYKDPCVIIVPRVEYNPLVLENEVTVTGILDKVTEVMDMVFWKGHTLIFLDTRLAHHFRMPYYFKERFAGGGFANIFHFVKRHPVFKGLPSNCLMGEEFCNIIPATAHIITDKEPQWLSDAEPFPDNGGIVAPECLAGCFHAGYHKTWWASDLTHKRYGKGNILFSQFRLIENIGKDPLADRLLSNIIKFGESLLP